jgi:hypothetical protein
MGRMFMTGRQKHSSESEEAESNVRLRLLLSHGCLPGSWTNSEDVGCGNHAGSRRSGQSDKEPIAGECDIGATVTHSRHLCLASFCSRQIAVPENPPS